MKFLLAFGVLGACISAPGFAQSTSECSDILKFGTFSSSVINDNAYYQQIVYSRFLSVSYEQSKTDTSLGGTIPIGEIVFGGEYTKDQFAQKQNQIKSTNFQQIDYQREVQTAVFSGDENITKRWSECMLNQDSSEGRVMLVLRPLTDTTVAGQVWWVPGRAGRRTGVETVRVRSDTDVSGGTVAAGDCLRKRYKLTENVCHFRISAQNPRTPVTVTINTEIGSGTTGFAPPRLKLARVQRPFTFKQSDVEAVHAIYSSIPVSREIRLSDDVLNEGWRFDPVSAKFSVTEQKDRWVHRCQNETFSVDLFRFLFAFEAFQERRTHSDRQTSVICTPKPVVDIIKEEWVPTNLSMLNETTSNLKALSDFQKLTR